MSRLQNELAVDIQGMYGSEDNLHTAVAMMKEAANNGETERQKMVRKCGYIFFYLHYFRVE
jgi:hypothetical protein